MSLFDIFNKKNIGETLGSLMDTAKEQASGLTKAAPGGVGGLVGAGALGALLTALITALSTASGVGLHIGAALCCAFLALMAGGILCFLRRYVTTRFTCSGGQSC